MSIAVRLIALACLAAAVTACNREPAAPADAAKPADAAPAAPPATTAPMTPPPAPETVSTTPVPAPAGEPVGVAECDDFLAKYETCVNSKMPAESRAAFTASVTQWRDAWRGLAKDPNTAASLAQVCTQQLEQTKQSMAAYGCTDW